MFTAFDETILNVFACLQEWAVGKVVDDVSRKFNISNHNNLSNYKVIALYTPHSTSQMCLSCSHRSWYYMRQMAPPCYPQELCTHI